MSRYRVVYCLIWNDDKFPFVSDDCQLVTFHILTTPYSSPFGCYKASMEALASEKRWDIAKYRKAFKEGSRAGFYEYDEKHQMVFIPSFLKYNPPNNPNVLKSWGKVFNELPNSKLKNKCLKALTDLVEGFGEAFTKAFQEGFEKPLAKVRVPDPVSDSVSVKKKQFKEFVLLTAVEHEKLIKKFGALDTDNRIETLNLYKGQTGATYKSDYYTILRWALKDRNNGGSEEKKPDLTTYFCEPCSIKNNEMTSHRYKDELFSDCLKIRNRAIDDKDRSRITTEL